MESTHVPWFESLLPWPARALGGPGGRRTTSATVGPSATSADVANTRRLIIEFVSDVAVHDSTDGARAVMELAPDHAQGIVKQTLEALADAAWHWKRVFIEQRCRGALDEAEQCIAALGLTLVEDHARIAAPPRSHDDARAALAQARQRAVEPLLRFTFATLVGLSFLGAEAYLTWHLVKSTWGHSRSDPFELLALTAAIMVFFSLCAHGVTGGPTQSVPAGQPLDGAQRTHILVGLLSTGLMIVGTIALSEMRTGLLASSGTAMTSTYLLLALATPVAAVGSAACLRRAGQEYERALALGAEASRMATQLQLQERRERTDRTQAEHHVAQYREALERKAAVLEDLASFVIAHLEARIDAAARRLAPLLRTDGSGPPAPPVLRPSPLSSSPETVPSSATDMAATAGPSDRPIMPLF